MFYAIILLLNQEINMTPENKPTPFNSEYAYILQMPVFIEGESFIWNLVASAIKRAYRKIFPQTV